MRHYPTAATGSFLALSCIGFIASAPALADDAEQIVVNGQGQSETSSPKNTAPLVDTPRTISVISEETIQNTASFSIEDALRTVPGITLGAGEGGVSSGDVPLIRGVNSTGDIFVDGVRDPGSQQRESFAIESIEVSKGPNGPMAGRGGAGGTINLVTKLAQAGSLSTAQVTAGTSDLIRVTGDVNRQLSDEVAIRVAGMYHDSMVAGRDRVFDDRWGIAPSVTFGLNGPLSATVGYYHLETDGMPDYGIPLTSRRQLNADPADPDIRRPADVDRDNFYGLVNRDFQRGKVDAVTGKVSAELAPGVVLSSTTRYSWTRNNYIVTNPDDSAGNVVRGLVWRNIKSRNARTEGVASNLNLSAEIATGSVIHSLAAGVEYTDTRQSNVPYVVATGNRACTPTDIAAFNCTDLFAPNPSDPWSGTITASPNVSSAAVRDTSAYLFDTVTLIPELLLSGGVRWTDYSARATGFTSGVPFSAASGGDFWSYQLGAIAKPSANTSLYVSYGNSKSPPGASAGEGEDALNLVTELQRPQGTESWEAGAKAEVFGGNLLLAGAMFQIDRSNIQQTDPTGAVTEVFAAARTRGFELSASGRAGPVTMLVGYTYLDAKLPDDAPANAGNALPQTPKHNLAATIAWQATPQLSIGGGAYGASRRYADPANLISAGGYLRFDAHAQYQISDHFSVRVNLNNVTDERYFVKLRNPHFAVPADGRQALVTLVARY
ncbi:TonB-dependent siderophore receptor [Parafrankia sp. BMG5.11]|uniref:TonB-dependent receptor n=1 Tax=Parafrankia sp. BMG5.11 TaxID=222540 RepID=UPI00103CBBD5|nr:TonB-dependent receptor [Parafrankia sp. BMG5.11]TCJ41458.1 TonB-dependent receptor [Parafrankia sp. BMG5.11]